MHAGSVNKANRNGLRPIHVAAAAGKHENIQLLLSRSADPEKRDDSGSTAGHLAVSSGCFEALELSAGALYDIDKTDYLGNSCLHLATAAGHTEMCTWLIDQVCTHCLE